jgi:hypothetical protein
VPELVAADGRPPLDGRTAVDGGGVPALGGASVVVLPEVDGSGGPERTLDEPVVEVVNIVARPVDERRDRVARLVSAFASIPPVFTIPVDDGVSDDDGTERGRLGRGARDPRESTYAESRSNPGLASSAATVVAASLLPIPVVVIATPSAVRNAGVSAPLIRIASTISRCSSHGARSSSGGSETAGSTSAAGSTGVSGSGACGSGSEASVILDPRRRRKKRFWRQPERFRTRTSFARP